MMRALYIASALFLTSACASAGEQGADLFAGQWQNERGSQVSFVVTGGEVRGLYQTNVGRPDKNQKFPLIGLVNGDQITFTVNFTGFNSMTAWTGQMTKTADGKDVIKTLWQNTKDIADDKEAADMWGSIRAGASDFLLVDRADGAH